MHFLGRAIFKLAVPRAVSHAVPLAFLQPHMSFDKLVSRSDSISNALMEVSRLEYCFLGRGGHTRCFYTSQNRALINIIEGGVWSCLL